ncbi:MarR family winged helix-turn-helix transcriptional regulator [Nocardia suismassiliense]|uniref:MarR family winged helix-turn-helix transcriptional regulator n=1 Tax=Nocardia suismassiliense TaxID=2077092 RepID=UPI0018FE8F27|nr:MarR family transcriptional regulator [Nocardia suismassiliense]
MAHPEDAALHHMRRILQDHGASWQARLPDLTRPQFAALSVLAASPGIDQVTLGARAAIDKSTLAGMLRRLEERGWVDRTPDRLDRRRQLLHLTAKGKAIVRAATPIADELDATALAPLTATEQQRLTALLTKLTNAIAPTRPHTG